MINYELSNELYNILYKNKLVISFAESCTGGLVSSSLINNDGASNVINESYITYSNESKIKLLNVSETTLSNQGAVSEECALEMATGLYNITKSNVCCSITGIAGPNGGTKDKPVGLVYFCIKYNNKHYVLKQVFKGTRTEVREQSVNYLFKEIINIIGG